MKAQLENGMTALTLPCKLVLVDYQGFLENSKHQGEGCHDLAKVIADLGFVRVYGIGYNDGNIPLLNTGIQHNGSEIGLALDELRFFTVHKA